MPTSQWYGQSAAGIVARLWVPTQMGVILMKNSFVPNIDTQLRYSDISTQELAAAGGYATGGKQIANRTTSYDSAADQFDLLGDDLSWGPGATFITRYGVIYEMASTDKYLWALLDFGADIPVNNGTFTIDWTTGLLAVKVDAAV